MKYTRNEFLRLTSVGISGAVTLGATSGFTNPSPRKGQPLKLGLASYTFRNFSLDDTIKWSKQLGLTGVSLKNMHLPFTTAPGDLKKATEKIKAAGLDPYAVGVIYMKTAKEVEDAFAYASNAGINMIVGAPNHELLPLVNEMVNKYNVKLAIHNHGPGDALYHSVTDVYEKVKSLDKRIGLCIDVGHVQRIAEDPVVMVERYKDRLYDIHMKDVNKNTGDGVPVEIGHGIINIPKLLKALNKINYSGYVAFEYEKDGEAPLAGLAESVGYVRGILKMS
ncbi:MAG: sugar phosphate isomerase/epimerase [Chitinophagaceae bacterium]